MSFNNNFFAALAIFTTLALSSTTHADVISVDQDVMTSAFFQGTNLVRGYTGDSRPTFRVSKHASGPETIYLTFDPTQFDSYTSPVASAYLSMESVDGGFGGNAGPGNPFTVSAHGMDADPLVSITDDTNPSGPTSWSDFLGNNVLAADAAASTDIDGFGTYTFDVTAVVNDWISGSNTVFALALTGENHNGPDYLHGFLNNTETPGSSFLTVTAVPEPTSLVLMLFGIVGVGTTVRRRQS